MSEELTPEMLLNAYASGYFPMADGRHEQELYWYAPELRGILPLETFHVPGSLKKFMRDCPYEVKYDTAFEDVIRACADMRGKKREETWINDRIIAVYAELARMGDAHSIECWQAGRLVGGLYGVSLGGAFFGESMFSHAVNASKVALVHLVECLKVAGYQLLDTQYVNDHLKQFGVLEIPQADYLVRLNAALRLKPKRAFK